MNVKLLRKVKAHILEEPKRLVMYGWAYFKHGKATFETLEGLRRTFPKCGTAGCIAGWTCILNGQKHDFGRDYFHAAQTLLGLTKKQAGRLFAPPDWPGEFAGGAKDDGTKETALIAAARIEHFIKTKGRE